MSTFASGGRRDGSGGASDGGKVKFILESALADLSGGGEVFPGNDAGASGKLGFVNGLFLAGDGLLSFVVKSFGFKIIFIVDVAPVVAPCASLAESLVHARLGLGSVLN